MDSATFRQRSQLALTHPVTIIAVGVLLLKSLWSNPWTTGKLSDLAWVVFALPLLAFLLSLVVRGENRIGQRTVWVVAYVGLPLLYAAFNTFPIVHESILRVLSLASGLAAGSPLDPTDSLVIPVGLAVALWVWRRGELAGTGKLRRRSTMLTAGVAVVATSQAEPDHGIARVWIAEPGILVASGRPGIEFESMDGGFTWRPAVADRSPVEFGSELEVATPRAKYVLRGASVMLEDSRQTTQEVYSTEYLRGSANEWTQRQQTTHLDRSRVTTTQPVWIVYDEQSENVVLALGLQGVVVGTPDGVWHRAGVDAHQPSDFSARYKSKLLLNYPDLWAMALSLAVAGMRASLWVSDLITSARTSESALTALRLLVAVALVVVTVLIAVSIMGAFGKTESGYSMISSGETAVMMATIGGFVAFGVLPLCWRQLFRLNNHFTDQSRC